MTYEEFVKRYCEGMTPTTEQANFIGVFLNVYFGNQTSFTTHFFQGGRGYGKTQLRRWLINFLIGQEERESGGNNIWVMKEYD